MYPDDQKMAAYIKNKSSQIKEQISIVGFPFDLQTGSQHPKHTDAPDLIRSSFTKAGPIRNAEYNLDMRNLEVKDLGNIGDSN